MCLCLYCVPDHIRTRALMRQNRSASSLSGAHHHTHFHACLWCSEHHELFVAKRNDRTYLRRVTRWDERSEKCYGR